MVFAKDEDAWDDLLTSHGVMDARRLSWTTSLREADQELSAKIERMNVASTNMGHKMWDVVVKEKELAKQEAEEREKRASSMVRSRRHEIALPSSTDDMPILDESGRHD